VAEGKETALLGFSRPGLATYGQGEGQLLSMRHEKPERGKSFDSPESAAEVHFLPSGVGSLSEARPKYSANTLQGGGPPVSLGLNRSCSEKRSFGTPHQAQGVKQVK